MGRRQVGCLTAQVAGANCEHCLHCLVELADAGKAGGESNLSHRHRCGLDEDACGLSPLRSCQPKGTGAYLGHEKALYLARAVTEPAGKAADALAVFRHLR